MFEAGRTVNGALNVGGGANIGSTVVNGTLNVSGNAKVDGILDATLATTSDRKEKKNIEPIKNASEKIKSLIGGIAGFGL